MVNMKKDYSHIKKKLTNIADQTLRLFVIAGFSSFAIFLLGIIISVIVSSITGNPHWTRFAISTFLFCIAATSLIADMHFVANIWIAIIRLMTKKIKIRFFISEIFAYCLVLSITLGVGFYATMYGIKYLIDPTILKNIT